MALALSAAAAPIVAAAQPQLQNQPTPLPSPATAQMQLAPAAPPDHMLRVGTPVPLRLTEALTTKEKAVRVGQRFNLEVAETVHVGDMIVIPVGSPAVAEITDVRNKGMWGKSGHLNAHVLYVTVAGRQIRMSGAFDEKGSTGTGGVIAAIAFLPVAGFFTTGTSATMPIGMPVKGFVDEDVPLVPVSAPVTAPLPAMMPTAQAASVTH